MIMTFSLFLINLVVGMMNKVHITTPMRFNLIHLKIKVIKTVSHKIKIKKNKSHWNKN